VQQAEASGKLRATALTGITILPGGSHIDVILARKKL